VFELAVLVLLSALATEAVVEIVTKSELFSPLMAKLALRDDFFPKLLTCLYCFSVWVAGGYAGLLSVYLSLHLLLLPILIFSIHRMANILHCSQDILYARSNKKSNH
jgi:hypothetical protein